jgi:hypothetical protein
MVNSIENARRFKYDNRRDRCEIELRDGRHIAESFHIDELRGLDVFHNRFAPDPRWNPPPLSIDRKLSDEFERLEETYADRPPSSSAPPIFCSLRAVDEPLPRTN